MVGYYRAMSFDQERSRAMSRRFKRPPVMDTTSVINGYSTVIEQGYAMLNSIPEECSVDRSLVGSMISKYKRAREGLADLLDVKVGPALTGAPEITRASRIDWASDTVEPDGQRVANHHWSPTVPSVEESNTHNEGASTMAKQYKSGVSLNSVNTAAHAPAATVEHRPLTGSVVTDGTKSVTFKAIGYGWVTPNGSTRRSLDVGTLWCEAFHYDWSADENTLTLSAEVMAKLLGRNRVVNMLINKDGITVDEPKDAAFRVKFGKK
jgi:hypothetical protein